MSLASPRGPGRAHVFCPPRVLPPHRPLGRVCEHLGIWRPVGAARHLSLSATRNTPCQIPSRRGTLDWLHGDWYVERDCTCQIPREARGWEVFPVLPTQPRRIDDPKAKGCQRTNLQKQVRRFVRDGWKRKGSTPPRSTNPLAEVSLPCMRTPRGETRTAKNLDESGVAPNCNLYLDTRHPAEHDRLPGEFGRAPE